MKRFTFFIMSILCITLCNAQIGYQVSLLNTATGEPRANEKVTAKIELSNSDGEAVYSETQTGVTNDFGVLSLTIGNAQSLSAIDWSKYPMFISVTVDNVLIGKTQVMSVPYANAVVPLSKDILVGTWSGTRTETSLYSISTYQYSIRFYSDGTLNFLYHYDYQSFPSNNANHRKAGEPSYQNGIGFYVINGNQIDCYLDSQSLLDSESSESENSFQPMILNYVNGSLFISSSVRHIYFPKLTKQ